MTIPNNLKIISKNKVMTKTKLHKYDYHGKKTY